MEIIVVAAILAMILALGMAVKTYDLKRKRDEEAISLQARISDALLMEPMLSSLPLTPTVRIPLWRGSPVTIELSGTVPNGELREAALRAAMREMARNRPDSRPEDHVAVDPMLFSRVG